MAVIPKEDQDLIDNLRSTLQDLYNQEEDAARNSNEKLRKAAHDEIIKIQSLIKSIVDYHIDKQNP